MISIACFQFWNSVSTAALYYVISKQHYCWFQCFPVVQRGFFFTSAREKCFALNAHTQSQKGCNKERVIYWQKNLRRGHSLSHRDILPSRRAKGEKQWPWKDDMPAQCHYWRNNKGCCWATRIRGHGNRGVFNVPESIMLLLPYSNASLQRPCPLMYLSQANIILILMSAPSLSHFLHPSPPPLWLSVEHINMWLSLCLSRANVSSGKHWCCYRRIGG